MGDLIKLDSTKFKIRNKSESEAEIIIYAEIGESWFDEGVSAKSFSNELKALPESVTLINVRINSLGGDVFEGVTIFNRLKQHKAKVVAYVDGIAASIASIILMAADEIVMSEGAQVMIHKPMSGVWGNSLQMQEMIDILDDIEEQMLGIYNRRTGMARSELKSLLAKETWFDAQEALDNGFADRIMENEESRRVAACDVGKHSWIRNQAAYKAPSETDIIRENISSTLTEVEDFLNK